VYGGFCIVSLVHRLVPDEVSVAKYKLEDKKVSQYKKSILYR